MGTTCESSIESTPTHVMPHRADSERFIYSETQDNIGEKHMGFRDTATADVKEAQSGNSDSNNERERVEQIEVDMSTIAFTHFHPTTIVTGEFPEDEGNPIIRFRDEQHNDGRKDQGYLGLVIDNPGVVADSEEGTEDTIILDVQDSNEVRVFNANDSETTVKEAGGEVMGVSYDGRFYDGEVVDEFPDDRIILVVSGSASKNVAKRLDVNGIENADMDEETGQVNGGLIEYPNGADADVSSRYARDPELRADLLGTEVALLTARREEMSDDVTGYLGEDGDANDGDPVLGEGPNGETHTDENKASYAELVAASERWEMKWFSVFADFGDGMEPVEPTEGEPTGYTYLEWNWDASAGGDYLPDTDYEFVTDYADSEMPTDAETIRANIEDHSDSLSDDPNVDRMIELIQNYSS